jgi:hypothetical protein
MSLPIHCATTGFAAMLGVDVRIQSGLVREGQFGTRRGTAGRLIQRSADIVRSVMFQHVFASGRNKATCTSSSPCRAGMCFGNRTIHCCLGVALKQASWVCRYAFNPANMQLSVPQRSLKPPCHLTSPTDLIPRQQSSRPPRGCGSFLLSHVFRRLLVSTHLHLILRIEP